jgi:hypothetical protein
MTTFLAAKTMWTFSEREFISEIWKGGNEARVSSTSSFFPGYENESDTGTWIFFIKEPRIFESASAL